MRNIGRFLGPSTVATIGLSSVFILVPAATANAAPHSAAVANSAGSLTTTLSDPGDDAAQEDDFGSAVAISGSTAIIGSNYVNQTIGAAYIYADTSDSWSLETTLAPPKDPLGSCFGCSVAISGNGPGATAIVGAPFAKHNKGAAYLYVESATGTWPTRPTAQLVPGEPSKGSTFGISVAVSGSGADAVALVGASGARQNVGAAFVYAEGTNGRWSKKPVATLSDTGGAKGDGFGQSVSVSSTDSGATTVVGAPGVDSSAGAVDIYGEGATSSDWTLATTLPDPGSNADHLDRFGYSVAVAGAGEGATTVVGAPGTSSDGSAYVDVEGSTPASWSPVTTFPDPAATAKDFFGDAVAVSGTGPGTSVLVGDDSAANGGSALLATEGSSTSTWTSAVLADPAGATNDEDGISVAVSGAAAMVGSEGFNSFAGAAYIYD